LIDCSFDGRLEDIRFDGRETESEAPWDVRSDAMVRCDLSNCSLSGVEFLGIDTRNFQLPNQGQRIPRMSKVARDAYQWAETADLDQNQMRVLQMDWRGHLTKLSDDADGWIDLEALGERLRGLVERSMGAGL